MFPAFELFEEVFFQLTNNNGCMVIENTVSVTKQSFDSADHWDKNASIFILTMSNKETSKLSFLERVYSYNIENIYV